MSEEGDRGFALSALVELLFALANRILAEPLNSDKLVELTGQYTQKFDSLCASLQEPASRAQISPTLRTSLEELQVLHNKVLDCVKHSSLEISQELRNVRRRGRGILSYLDKLPKRISSFRERKG